MDKLILEGRVSFNGAVVDNPGVIVDPLADRVAVDGSTVVFVPDEAVYLLNKPAGYITTLDDPQGRNTVQTFIEDIPLRLFPVGRLDKETTGLLLFTNIGKLCHRLTHPSFGVEKEYSILADGPLTTQRRRSLEQGVRLEEGVTSPARVIQEEMGGRRFHLILHEGWNRQVRRMCLEVGIRVLQLERVRYGFLDLEGVAVGTMRRLSPDEVTRLRTLVSLD